MKNHSIKNREDLKRKMATVFGDRIQALSQEYREILLDDLVTAFENRIKVLNPTEPEQQFQVRIKETADCTTVQI